jgi:transposase
VARFRSRHHSASYNRNRPHRVSSGGPGAPRVNTKGDRKLNHVIHIVAVTESPRRGCAGHASYRRKLREGKTEKKALRALKRRISDAIRRWLSSLP